MANYKLDSIDLNAGRSELHNALALTGCEVSCNNLPAGGRCLKAGKNGLRYLCIQSARNSLKGFTMTDGVVEEGAKAPKPSWM